MLQAAISLAGVDAHAGGVRARRPGAARVGGPAHAVPDELGSEHADAARRLNGVLRRAGFSVVLTAHALSAVDAYVYGFAMQERALPFDIEQRITEVVQHILAAMPADRWSHLAEFSREHVLQPGYDYGQEFEWGLNLVLDGLERAPSV